METQQDVGQIVSNGRAQEFAPVALFGYRRPEHLKRTLQALSECEHAAETELFIFVDGPRNSEDRPLVEAVREIAGSAAGFKSVSCSFSDRNRGLASSVISGVSTVLERFERVIVVEDDLRLEPGALEYFNRALEFYRTKPWIMSITAYCYGSADFRVPQDYLYDVFLNPRSSSWGWATWRDRWNVVDWSVPDARSFLGDPLQRAAFNVGGDDLSRMLAEQLEGKIDSWAIRWAYWHHKLGRYCLYPVHSLVTNEGFDGSGQHCGIDRRFSGAPEHRAIPCKFPEQPIVVSRLLAQQRVLFGRSLKMRLLRRLRFLR